MVRKLKFHEQKLLKKVDFIDWKKDSTLRENKILRKYHIQKSEDYTKYNKLCGSVHQLATKIKELSPKDPYRIECTKKLLLKLYNLGLVNDCKDFSLIEKVTSSSFCRRRLPVVMHRIKMAEHIKDAVKYIEQGHVRVGPEVVQDPAYLVPRNMEDYITWVDSSKIRKHVMEYNDIRDDFDLM
ncbi:U3 small nucleolar ribonucleoprotein protein IMP3 [Hydra vulgaris]|uniref:U3 small nucleolar ribonucleoprotein protein IMP3 n=1 Tax=Hydra vulgaris TaxID=6087 RepID=T2M557_HYDVU|nr:U3 small nucleolar ribonucleoprotein protein IMP3-like [Hydra vulgaris]